MTVGIDIDNVICNTAETVLNIHYKRTGEKVNPNNITSYDMTGYISEKYRTDFNILLSDMEVWENMKLLPHCSETIRWLYENGYDIYFITSGNYFTCYSKLFFLKKHFPFLNIEKRFIQIHNKQMIKVDCLIDDYEQNLIDGEYNGLLFTYPWNAEFYENTYNALHDNKIIRVNDWREVKNRITIT